MSKQTTLVNSVSCHGVGLHSGSQVTLTLHPAPADSGIMFKRLDVESAVSLVPARWDAVCETRLGTTIVNSHGVTVSTIEHLMAALWGAGVDNVLIELDGPEVPIMDGSSEPFVFLIECAGLKTLESPRRMLRVLKTIEVHEGQSTARVQPNLVGEEGCVMDIDISYNSDVIKRQQARYDFRDITFKQNLSRARTFGFAHEVEMMRKNGLALGGSLANAIVVGENGVLNKEGLRYQDEFVRHKALDCLGDLYLAGLQIDGHFSFMRPGHAINNALLRALMADESAYEIVAEETFDQPVALSALTVPAYV